MVKNIFRKGQSYFEIIVVMLIISLVITAIAGLALLSIKSAIYSRNRTLASRYGQEATEWLRGERDKGWDNFKTNIDTYPTICLDTLAWGQPASCTTPNSDGLERLVSFNYDALVNPVTEITAEVKVSWTDSGGTHDSKSIVTFSNWQGK